jgi:hypothetical protein
MRMPAKRSVPNEISGATSSWYLRVTISPNFCTEWRPAPELHFNGLDRSTALNRERFETRSCGCYSVVKTEYDGLLPNKFAR